MSNTKGAVAEGKDIAGLDRPGKFARTDGGWTEIATFGSRKDAAQSEIVKALVTEKGNVIVFDRLRKSEREGPVGNESALYDNVADPVPDAVYSALDRYVYKPPIVLNRQFDSMRNSQEMLNYLSDPGSYGIASGRKPSGPCHFGHKLVIETISFFQKNGAQIFVPIADNEASLDPKIRNASQYMYFAADNLLDWGASGLNLDAAHVYLQSEEMRVMNLGYAVARGLDLSLSIDVYGRETMVDEMRFLFASITQVGDILLPQHPDFGKSHSFMLSGADQDGNMTMTAALARKLIEAGTSAGTGRGVRVKTAPSSLYVRSVSNLEGRKESASEPDTTIYLGPTRNVYLKTETGKVLDSVRKLSLEDRVLDMFEKVDRFNRAGSAQVAEAISRRRLLFREFENEESEMDRDRFKHLTAEAINEHRNRREAVFEYALLKMLRGYDGKEAEHAQDIARLRRAGEREIPGFDAGKKPAQPHFWGVPAEAFIPEDKRKVSTRWTGIVAGMADQIIL